MFWNITYINLNSKHIFLTFQSLILPWGERKGFLTFDIPGFLVTFLTCPIKILTFLIFNNVMLWHFKIFVWHFWHLWWKFWKFSFNVMHPQTPSCIMQWPLLTLVTHFHGCVYISASSLTFLTFQPFFFDILTWYTPFRPPEMLVNICRWRQKTGKEWKADVGSKSRFKEAHTTHRCYNSSQRSRCRSHVLKPLQCPWSVL